MRRLGVDWKLLLSIFSGFVIVCTLAGAAPLYLDSLRQLAFHTSLDRLSAQVLTFQIFGSHVPLTEGSLASIEESLTETIARDIPSIYLGRESYYGSPTNLVGLPDRPLPKERGTGEIVSRGSFQYLSNLGTHVRFLSGRMARSEPINGPDGPIVEAVISPATESEFGLAVGDIVTLTPDLGLPFKLSAQITGVFEPVDSPDGYWEVSHIFLDQAPLGLPPMGEAPPPQIQVDPDERPVVLFLTGQAMVDIVGPAFQGVVVNPIWTVRADKQGLKEWSISEADRRITSFESGVARAFDRMTLGSSAVAGPIADVGRGYEVYYKGSTHLVELPARPLPKERGTGETVARGSVQHLSNLGTHVIFLSGRMARSEPTDLEGVISSATQLEFGLAVGDVVTLTPDLGSPSSLSARITGVFEPANPHDAYWQVAGAVLDQPPLGVLPEGEAPPSEITVAPEEPPVVLFITRQAMLHFARSAFPAGGLSPIWTILGDRSQPEEASLSDDGGLPDSEIRVGAAFAQVSVSTGPIRGLIGDIRRSSFFSSVPLLLLAVGMVITVLFQLSMAVGYLLQGRLRDAALLRSRGVGTARVTWLYATEGLVMALLAVLVATPLAVATVALAGRLPYFRDMTESGLLTVRLVPTTFVSVSLIGLMCLLIYVIPPVLGTRIGPLMQRLRTSRPPSVPFLHRYYIDLALMAVGGLVYWELQVRERFITSGLFKDEGVNEALLLAPALFLILAALAFLRFFPLLVRFFGGESPAFLHVIASASVLVLATGIALGAFRDGGGVRGMVPAAVVLGVGLVYWATHRTRGPRLHWAGLAAQAALVAWFLVTQAPGRDDLLFIPTVGLATILPGQVVFLLLRAVASSTPVWVSIGLSHMARDPLQYTWLVLLLVLATGLGILATTVGGTLERSQTDRIQYEIPTDIRIEGVPAFTVGGVRAVMERYLESPGVAAASVALRTRGVVGSRMLQVLALDSAEAANLSWYFREDFSDRSLGEVMAALRLPSEVDKVMIPEEATTIGLWAKPERADPGISLWMVLEGGDGKMTTVSLGNLDHTEWSLYTGKFPGNVKSPVELVSVQLFEAAAGTSMKSGALWIDDIHVTAGPNGEEKVLEDFEQPLVRWLPIVTSELSQDSVSATSLVAHRGSRSGLFTYGKEMAMGLRGFYRSPSGGRLPVVVSSSFTQSTGFGVGDAFMAEVEGRPVPAVVRGTVSYFPTMNALRSGFILADLDLLLRALNMMRHPSAGSMTTVRPNELFMRKTGGSEPVGQVLDKMTAMMTQVADSTEHLESVRLDPFATAGWRAAMFLSLGVVLVSAAFGYASYLSLFAIRSRNEMGFLQAMGLSRLQLIGLLGFEHLAIAALGLGLGTWSGLQMSRLMVAPLAVTETGHAVIPPFILMTDWSLILPTLVAVVGLFLVALVILGRSIARLDFNTVVRGAEY